MNDTFATLGVPANFVRLLDMQKIETPTPIQAQAIPVALTGKDVIGIANTGTGKTMAFALPMLSRLEFGECGLVIAPTRELASQIQEAYRSLEAHTALLVGGESMHPQYKALRRKPMVIIATPGRLMDHINQGSLRLNHVRIAVLDEADRMFDMGFAPAIKKLLRMLPSERQTMLFSATMPEEIASTAKMFMRNPARLEVATQGTVPTQVSQELIYVESGEKANMLRAILAENDQSVLVFARTRHGARKLAKTVSGFGHSSAELHSDRTLAQRREALNGFKAGRYRVLVATDIAARGIDVKELERVINYDLPDCAEDYVHRIGRTGRAGALGEAISIATTDQGRIIRDIEKLIGEPLQPSARSTVQPRARTQEPRSGAAKRRFGARRRNAGPSRTPSHR